MKLFSIYDVKAGYYLKIFPESSPVQALRGFDGAVNESKSLLAQYPDDFYLHELADFDTKTGLLSPHLSPLNLGSARSVLREAPKQMELHQ